MASRMEEGFYPDCAADDAQTLARDIRRHVVSSLGADDRNIDAFRAYQALALSVRDRLIANWIRTQRRYYDLQTKRVYYLSMEFLPGRFLVNNLLNLGLLRAAREALQAFGLDLETVEEVEWDAGLGNGGLGRLASCYLDSMANLRIPGYGYGIRYDYGIFYQLIQNGYQVERPDNWLRLGNMWEYDRPEHLYEVKFFGRSVSRIDAEGRLVFDWVDSDNVMAMACDILIPGYRNGNTLNMRLWSAKSSREFHLEFFNSGNYVGAIEDKVRSENISKMLYPSEAVVQGRELRLKQEYFFVSATFQDIMRRFHKRRRPFEEFPDLVAVQLNDTHPAIAVAELMRLLVDEERLEWDKAWDITVRTFGYTNHTVLPEALETWPVELFERLLPRHLQLIFEINARFLNRVAQEHPGDAERLRRVSLIAEVPEKRVRMAHLAIVGSHAVNGVSALHSRILKEELMADFAELFPKRFTNVTNGVTQRRFLMQANPRLADLIGRRIGADWATNLACLRGLEEAAEDPEFVSQWQAARRANKADLARWLQKVCLVPVDPDSLFDVQVKRIHEYKRQLLNVLHVITLFNRICAGQAGDAVPRTVLFGGKAAPGYVRAKLIIKLINAVADAVRREPRASGRLNVLFVPNYCVSIAEKLISGCDLSEQISTAGMEASGTGNMKFALNGALIIGTLDGANVEILEEIGPENIFIFGHTAEEVSRLRAGGHDPRGVVAGDRELRLALDMIARGVFSPGEPDLFQPLLDTLLDGGDYFMVLADYRRYLECQEQVSRDFQDETGWSRRSILSVARMGKFSSDRSVMEYARRIWQVRPIAEQE